MLEEVNGKYWQAKFALSVLLFLFWMGFILEAAEADVRDAVRPTVSHNKRITNYTYVTLHLTDNSWLLIIKLSWRLHNKKIIMNIVLLETTICKQLILFLIHHQQVTVCMVRFFFICVCVCVCACVCAPPPLHTRHHHPWRAPWPVHVTDLNAQSSLLHAADRGTAWEPKHLLRSRRSARSEWRHVHQWGGVERAVTAR